MGWFDDIAVRVSQATGIEVQDINSYVQKRVVDPVVKQVIPESLNQPSIAAPSAPASALQNAAQASQIAVKAAGSILPFVAVGALLYFAFQKSGRKG